MRRLLQNVAWIQAALKNFGNEFSTFPFLTSGIERRIRERLRRRERRWLNERSRRGEWWKFVHGASLCLRGKQKVKCSLRATLWKARGRGASCVSANPAYPPALGSPTHDKLGAASVFIIALLTVACGGNPPPVVVPTVPRPLPLAIGINDGFHGPLPPDIVAHYCGYGKPLLIRSPQLSYDGFAAMRDSLKAGCDQLSMIALIEHPDPALSADVANGLSSWRAIEIGNELELPPHNLSQAQYVTAVVQMHDAARQAGFSGEIIAGAVYAITDDTKRRVEAVAAACPDCSLGLHIYEAPSSADLNWIRGLNRRVWVTEAGSPTGCGTGLYQQQWDFLRGLTNTLATVENIVGVIYYQRPSGPSCSNLDTFGFQATDGAWKPADALLK